MSNKYKFDFYPFVKWVGGKRKVISEYLVKYLPESFNNYYEAFVGGGSMMCFLQHHNAKINDINSELILTYKIIKSKPKLLMKQLDKHKNNHSKEYYYNIRDWVPTKKIDIAARFIYLNKTCFNGIYRVNSNGLFNTPFNNIEKDKLNLYDKDNIFKMSQYFKNNKVKFYNLDYSVFLKKPKKNDFVFIDSPYDYEIGEKGFDSYNKSSFGQQNQILLSKCLKELDKKGIKFMATNHSTKLIKEIYKDFKLIEITTDRFINSDSSKRKQSAKEIIITNY